MTDDQALGAAFVCGAVLYLLSKIADRLKGILAILRADQDRRQPTQDDY